MSTRFQRITPFLWFASQAEEAANYYVAIFPNSAIGKTARYDKASAQACGQSEGAVMTIAFNLDGHDFVALNGGPIFSFTPAVSFVISCETQAEIDRYWDALSAGGDASAQQCGWLKDKFGLSWQVVPANMAELIAHPKAMQAMMQMKKIDIETLRRAAR